MPDRFFLGPWNPVSAAVYGLAVLTLCLCVTIVGFRITNETNSDETTNDQSAYSQMARQMQDSLYPWYTDGTRNPLVPWLTTRFADSGQPGFFVKAKQLNVLFGVVGTALLALFFALYLGPLPAFNTTALSALAIILPISTFFGAEAVFYILFLLLVVCSMRLLRDNPIWLYAVLGLLAGLAWLAKPSATPFLGLFGIFCGLRLLLNRWRNLPWPLAAPAWSAKRFFVGLALCLAIFLALISPRLMHAQKEWGSAFYSLPSFWFWADDWKTCQEKYADCRKETLARLPPEEQPTLAGYFRRHSLGDAVERVLHGSSVRLEQWFYPGGKWFKEKSGKLRRMTLPQRGFYLGGLAALTIIMAAMALTAGKNPPRAGPFVLPLLLWLATIGLYLAAMGWYLPTGPGHRFILTLYLPTLWLLVQGSEQFRRAAGNRAADGIFLVAHLILATLMVWRTADLMLGPSFEKVIYAF